MKLVYLISRVCGDLMILLPLSFIIVAVYLGLTSDGNDTYHRMIILFLCGNLMLPSAWKLRFDRESF